MKATYILIFILLASLKAYTATETSPIEPKNKQEDDESNKVNDSVNSGKDRNSSQYTEERAPNESIPPGNIGVKDDGEEFVPLMDPKRQKESEGKPRRAKRSPNGESRGARGKPRHNTTTTRSSGTTSSSSSSASPSDDDMLVKKSYPENKDSKTANSHNDDHDSQKEQQQGPTEEERLAAEEEMKQRKMREEHIKRERERQKVGTQIAKQTLRAATDERCDWRARPLSFLKGEVCGSYYKVLGIDRKEPFDKNSLKKAFRQVSLSLHPDKNPANEADSAFKYLNTAFDCLSDDSCRVDYDSKLEQQQLMIATNREELKRKAISFTVNALTQAYHGISVAATHVYQFGLDIWTMASEWEIDFMGLETVPAGKILMTLVLLTKGQLLLKLHGLAYLVVRLNYEIAKSRGMV